MRCEDFPCCGHENGLCPDFDPETGAQLNMKCTCGATVPLGGSSLCGPCLSFDPDDPWGDDGGGHYWGPEDEEDEEDEEEGDYFDIEEAEEWLTQY